VGDWGTDDSLERIPDRARIAFAWLVTVAVGTAIYFSSASARWPGKVASPERRCAPRRCRFARSGQRKTFLPSTVVPLAFVIKGDVMVEIREFITVFYPEAIQVLASALDDAWDRIQKSGSRFARPAYARAMREVLAKRIIEAAQRGEKDKFKLAADAVKFLAANYMDDNAGKAAAAKHGGSEADTPRLRSSRALSSIEGSDFSKPRWK
jgi:hypothetical protein